MRNRWHTESYRTVRAWFSRSLEDAFEHFGHKGDVAAGVEINMREICTAMPFGDALSCLEGLKGGYGIAVASNIDRREIGEVLRVHPLPHDLLVTSEDARTYKPDAAFFRFALEKACVKPEEVVHVGDSWRSDVGGAHDCGLAAVWLNRNRKKAPAGACAPAGEIVALAELPGIIERFSRGR